MKPLCIYHGNCADGFTAAYVVWLALDGQADFHAGVYQDDPPPVAGRDVIMVDFSYKLPVLQRMAVASRSLLVLDHHKSAAEDLKSFGPPEKAASWAEWSAHIAQQPAVEGKLVDVMAIFDMARSGAGLTWDFFFPNSKRPVLVDLVEDRDLFLFHRKGSREIHTLITSHPFDFKTWDWLAHNAEEQRSLQELLTEGTAIDRKLRQDVTALLPIVTRRMSVGGHDVPIANLPIVMTTEAGHRLAKSEQFGGCYWDTPEGRVFSLRSTDAGLDVAAIAVRYGGGGHRNAAGFRIPFEKLAPDGGPGTP